MIKLLCFIALFIANEGTSYSEDVTELTPSNFNELVVDNDDIWIVIFYSHNCPICVATAPEFSKAAKTSKGYAKFGAIDAVTYVNFVYYGGYNIEGYPAVRIFGENKQNPEVFQYPVQHQYLIEAVRRVYRRNIPKVPNPSNTKEAAVTTEAAVATEAAVDNEGSLYTEDVAVLTPSNFNEMVVDNDDIWIVVFYLPHCGSCRYSAPEVSKAAKALKKYNVKVGAMDSVKYGEYVYHNGYVIERFPGIRIFGENKQNPEVFLDPVKAPNLIGAARRAYIRKYPQTNTKEAAAAAEAAAGNKESLYSEGGYVTELTSSNFDELVVHNDDIWFVIFYSHNCIPCHDSAPEFVRAAKELNGYVKFGAIDAVKYVHFVFYGPYNIQGYPAIRIFGVDKQNPEEYKLWVKFPILMETAERVLGVKKNAAGKNARAAIAPNDTPAPETSNGGTAYISYLNFFYLFLYITYFLPFFQ